MISQSADPRRATEPRPVLLAGEHVTTADAQPVIYPYDGSQIGAVCLATDEIVERALATAHAAEPEMASIPPYERAEILATAAGLVKARADSLARQMTLETGLALRDSEAEAQRTAEIFMLASDVARRAGAAGELVPIDAVARGAGRVAWTKRFPVGTVLGITAFNAPLVLAAHKLAPAFAAGCPFILKPAPKTPLSALSLGEIMLEAGAPPAAVSVMPTTNALAERMVRDPRVKMLSFTGSARAGWYLKGITAARSVTLELGGNGAVIVHADADVDYAATRCAAGGFVRAGQACNSVQRLYVHESVIDDFRDRLAAQMGAFKVGDPLDPGTAFGGLIDERAAERAVDVVDEAKAAGATVVTGGTRDASVVAPTLIMDASEDLRVCTDEVFAPIIVLSPYDDVGEVFGRVNDTPFGLQAGLFTRDIRVITEAFERLEVGALIVNDVNGYRVDQMPYGGLKDSGTGREGLAYAVREMTEERLIVIDPR